jgi:hypothetical protein
VCDYCTVVLKEHLYKRMANVPFNAFIKVYRSERTGEMMGQRGQKERVVGCSTLSSLIKNLLK